ncbi:hypothetical protein [Halomontanus rarus]|uniref:hypothetical protein n=1 Tax=Halomontanus rarus TaxID=3034020 RepID=UPI0023E861B8|nr:hypothetical protein [Halovivax sp. TS33]
MYIDGRSIASLLYPHLRLRDLPLRGLPLVGDDRVERGRAADVGLTASIRHRIRAETVGRVGSEGVGNGRRYPSVGLSEQTESLVARAAA